AGSFTGGVGGGARNLPGGFPPGGAGSFGGLRGAPPSAAGSGGFPVTGGPGSGGNVPGQRLQVNSQLVAYLEAHQGGAEYLFATLGSQTAAPYIIATGKPVMALGGFNGSDAILSLSQLKALIRAGTVRYFLLSGGSGPGGGGPGGSGNAQLTQWITANCAQVAASAYGGSSADGQLYVCTSATLNAAGT
ncbi:MAG: hypothetical protein ACRDHP_17740, partial [Ktedonobacterales bacterium]